MRSGLNQTTMILEQIQELEIRARALKDTGEAIRIGYFDRAPVEVENAFTKAVLNFLKLFDVK